MGLYEIDCFTCKKPFMWFSGNLDQRCTWCRTNATMVDKLRALNKAIDNMSDDELLALIRKSEMVKEHYDQFARLEKLIKKEKA